MRDKIIDHELVDIPYSLYSRYVVNHATELITMMEYPSEKVLTEITELRNFLKRPVMTIQRYAKTKHAATYLDVDPSFLDKKRRKGIFQLGKHYFKPTGSNLVLWDLDALQVWVTETGGTNDDSHDIIAKMFT